MKKGESPLNLKVMLVPLGGSGQPGSKDTNEQLAFAAGSQSSGVDRHRRVVPQHSRVIFSCEQEHVLI